MASVVRDWGRGGGGTQLWNHRYLTAESCARLAYRQEKATDSVDLILCQVSPGFSLFCLHIDPAVLQRVLERSEKNEEN